MEYISISIEQCDIRLYIGQTSDKIHQDMDTHIG